MLVVLGLFYNGLNIRFGDLRMKFILEASEQKIILPNHIDTFPLANLQGIQAGIVSGMGGFNLV